MSKRVNAKAAGIRSRSAVKQPAERARRLASSKRGRYGRKPRLLIFGGWMKRARMEAGLMQAEVAKQLGYEGKDDTIAGIIGKYENGYIVDPEPEFLLRWANLFQKDYIEVLIRLAHDKYTTPSLVGGERAWSETEETFWKLVLRIFPDRDEVGGVIGMGLHKYQMLAKAKIASEDEILDMQGLALWEKHFPNLVNCWIVALQFIDVEDEAFAQALVHNLNRGVRYTFFVPEELIGPTRDFEYLKKKLIDSDAVRGDIVETHLVGIPLNSAMQQHLLQDDYVIANPLSGRKAVGFRCLRKPQEYGTFYKPRPTFALRMLVEPLDRLVDEIKRYIRTPAAHLDLPPELRALASTHLEHILAR